MSEGGQEKRVEPNIGQPIELPPNPALGILRFFVWLAPTGIIVLCLFLSELSFFQLHFGGSSLSTLGIGMFLSCAWFDSKLALSCRLGKRSRSSHMAIYMITQVLFVVPALLFAIVYAICAGNPW